jgi:hypothetical protein
VLNELLIIGRQNMQAMENLIEVARFKRDSQNDKQANLMRARRHRERLAVELEELLTGRKFSVEERRQFLLKQYEQWNVAKDKHIANLGDAFIENNNELPGWAEKNAFIQDFWAHVDRDLPALIKEAKKVLSDRKVTRKRVVIVEKPKVEPTNPVVKQALQRVYAGKTIRRKR